MLGFEGRRRGGLTPLQQGDLAQGRQARTAPPRPEGSVHLAFRRRAGGTVLRDLRQSGAMRARFPRRPGGEPPEAVLLTAAGGLTGGDRIDVGVALSAGAEATVTSA